MARTYAGRKPNTRECRNATCDKRFEYKRDTRLYCSAKCRKEVHLRQQGRADSVPISERGSIPPFSVPEALKPQHFRPSPDAISTFGKLSVDALMSIGINSVGDALVGTPSMPEGMFTFSRDTIKGRKWRVEDGWLQCEAMGGWKDVWAVADRGELNKALAWLSGGIMPVLNEGRTGNALRAGTILSQ